MLSQPRGHSPHPHAIARSVAGVFFALLTSLGTAAPNQSSDPMSKFLAEKGLLGQSTDSTAASSAADAVEAPHTSTKTPAAAPGFVQQMRDGASDMVITAMNFLGVPYKRGGNTEETGFDCSGFTRHIFEKTIGLILPRRADEQAQSASLITIARDELRPGDLVFFNTLKRTFSHVGIYVGEGKFIHSPRTGSEVRVEDMRVAYWNQRFTGARRAPQVHMAPAATTTTKASPAQPSVQPASSFYSGGN
jgi:cell wall-associated NlpC family hydrolase